MDVPRVREARSGREVCPFCREGFGDDSAVLVCEGCAVTYHEACLQEMVRCATLGCVGKRAAPRTYGGGDRAASRPFTFSREVRRRAPTPEAAAATRAAALKIAGVTAFLGALLLVAAPFMKDSGSVAVMALLMIGAAYLIARPTSSTAAPPPADEKPPPS
jgi:hypothetical protein